MSRRYQISIHIHRTPLHLYDFAAWRFIIARVARMFSRRTLCPDKQNRTEMHTYSPHFAATLNNMIITRVKAGVLNKYRNKYRGINIANGSKFVRNCRTYLTGLLGETTQKFLLFPFYFQMLRANALIMLCKWHNLITARLHNIVMALFNALRRYDFARLSVKYYAISDGYMYIVFVFLVSYWAIVQ